MNCDDLIKRLDTHIAQMAPYQKSWITEKLLVETTEQLKIAVDYYLTMDNKIEIAVDYLKSAAREHSTAREVGSEINYSHDYDIGFTVCEELVRKKIAERYDMRLYRLIEGKIK